MGVGSICHLCRQTERWKFSQGSHFCLLQEGLFGLFFLFFILLPRIMILPYKCVDDAIAMAVSTGKESTLLSLTAHIRKAHQLTMDGM